MLNPEFWTPDNWLYFSEYMETKANEFPDKHIVVLIHGRPVCGLVPVNNLDIVYV